MKNNKSIKIICTIILIVFSLCGCGQSAEKRNAEYKQQADKLASEGKYFNAITAYEYIGETQSSNMRKMLAPALVKTYQSIYHEDEREKILELIELNQISKEQLSIEIANVLDDEFKKISILFDQQIVNGYDYEINSAIESDLKSLESAINKMKEDYSIPNSIYDKLYLNKAKSILKWGNEYILFTLEEALEELKKCKEGSEGFEIISAIDNIQKGSFIEPYNILSKFFHDDTIIRKIFKDNYNYESITLENSFDYYRVTRKIDGNNIRNTYNNLAEAFQNIEDVEFGYEFLSDNYTLSKEERHNMPSMIAQNPAGKILIIERFKYIDSSKKGIEICYDCMNNLPDTYFPNNLAEVEYVIFMDATCVKVGRYSSGADAIKATINMKVYNAVTQKTIYTEKVVGNNPRQVVESGKPFYGGLVNMRSSLIKAAEIIMADQK